MKIRELIDDMLCEAIVIPKIGGTANSPLRDSDTVRVYHGTSSLDMIFVALTKGITGSMRAYRKYSYENNNNPRGLFVTPDLKTAKEFGDYVIEFHTRVSDLEAPVWPGGSFTVQGGYSQYFKDDEEREMERIRQRGHFSQSEMDYIRNSDRPELAATLMAYGERQALFVGSLNSNSIRAVWVSSDPTRVHQPYVRMSPREFLEKAKKEGIRTRYDNNVTSVDTKSEYYQNARNKIVKPLDDISGEQFVALMLKKYPHLDMEELLNILKNNPDYISRPLWSKSQIDRVTSDIMGM